MEDIYSNLDNYNEEATIEELKNENKELKFQLEDLNVRLETLQRDFDKLYSEHKRLESNYSSLLKTAKAEVERKTQAIAMLNAEKDNLVLQTLQNRNRRFIPKNNEPANRNDKKKNNKIQADKHSIELDRKETRMSPNIDPYRKDSRISPKENMVKHVTDSSAKENIAQKRPNIDDKPSSRIKNRRKSMPVFDTPKFSSDEEFITNVEEHFVPREYPDRHIVRHIRPSIRSSECSSLEERNSYEQTKDVRRRHHGYVESEKSRNYDRTDDKFRSYERTDDRSKNYDRSESHRLKRESPIRSKRRNYDIYEEKRTDYNRHKSPPNDKYSNLYEDKRDYNRHKRLESPPPEKYSNYSLRQHPNYEKLRYQDIDKHSHRHAKKHKADEYDEPKSKKMKPNTHQRQYDDDKHQIVDEYDKQFTSCQSPDINFIESSPNNHPVKEIKLSATTKLDDPRKLSDRYVKDPKGKDTLVSVRSINLEIPRIPVQNTCYEIECVKMPEALREKPASDDLLNQIYNIDDNSLIDISVESGEIPFEPEDEIVLQPQKTYDEKRQISHKTSTQTDNIHKDSQQSKTSYRIPKLKSCVNTQNSKNKDMNVDLSIKRKDRKSSDNILEVEPKQNKSKCRKKSLNEDLKKENILEIKATPAVVDKPEMPSLHVETDKLPSFNLEIEENDEHESRKQSKKIVEDDLLLSDETSDYTELHKTKNKVGTSDYTALHKTIDKVPIDNNPVSETPSLNIVQSSEIPSQTDTCKEISPDDKKIKTKRKNSKHKNTHETKADKPAKKLKEKHEVKNKEVIKHKFSELFGDSSSLILPEDLGLPSVPVQSQPTELPIFEDAQDAIDVNVNKEIPKFNEILAHKSVEKETDTFLKLPKLNEIETDKTVVEDTNIPKHSKLTEIETKKHVDNEQIKASKPAKTDVINKEIKNVNELPIQSIYQNLEIGVKPIEDLVKTVIISTGVQPSIAINDNKPLIDQSKPSNINLKALATSTPYKLDPTPSHVVDINPKVIETNGHTINSEDNLNTTDNSLSNVNETDIPDVRIVLKRRRKVMKKT